MTRPERGIDMRRRRYRGSANLFSATVLALLMTLLLIVQLPTTASASENRIGFDMNVVAEDGEDVSILGADVFVDARDAGDISIAGGDITVEGSSRGDISIAGGDITVEADVRGELSVAGGDVNIVSDVGGELSLAGGDVHYTGTADDEAHIVGGSVTLDGTFNDDLFVGADHFEIAPTSVINGDFEFRGPNEPTLPEGLTINGTYTYEYTDLDDVFDGNIPEIIFPVIAIAGVVGAVSLLFLLPFAVLIGGGVLLLLMTGLTARTIDGIRKNPFGSIGMGVAVLLGLFAIAVLLCVTIIGIPLALAIFWFYPVLILIGFIVAVLGVPYMVLRKNPRETSAGAKLGIFFVSLLVLLFLFAIPGVGQLLFFVIMLMGVGAFGAAVLGGKNEQAA